MYEKIIEPLLTNSIIVDWIAPIITAIITTMIIAVFGKIIHNEKRKHEVIEANNKILETIRPFIIQQNQITKEMIISIVMAISLENKIDTKYLYDLDDIKNRLILDIAETRFIKENDKLKMVEQINKVFVETVENEDEQEVEIHQNKVDYNEYIDMLYKIYMVFFILTLILFSVCDVTKIQNEFLKNTITFCVLFVVVSPIGLVFSKIFEMIIGFVNWIIEKIEKE